MIKLIVFDFDGVISDNYELHYQMSRVQIKDLSREEHCKLFDRNIHIEREKLKNRNTGYDLKSAFNEAKKYMVVEDLVKRGLERLAEDYILGIISSAKEEGLLEFLEKNKIGNLFSFVYGLESGVSKIEKFERVFGEHGFSGEDCVFVTDTIGDVKEGLKVGVKSIGVDFGYHQRERFAGSGVERVVSSFEEIGEVISKMN